MSFTRTAIENNRVTALAVIVIFLAGLSTYRTIPRDEDPGFTIRTAVVSTIFPGASPERVEQLVTDKLEEALKEMPEIDFLNSESKSGSSLIFVNVRESYKEMRPIWDSLRRKVDKARGQLPDEVRGPFVNDEFGDIFGVIVTLTGDGFDGAELHQVAKDVREELLRLDQVAKVELHGVQDEAIFVEYNNARLADLGISPLQFRQMLESRNIIIPGGSVRVRQAEGGRVVGDERIVLEPSGNFESLADLERTVINLPGRAEVVFLEDLAEVRRGYVDPPRSLVHQSGQPAIAVAVSMRAGGNVITLGNQVRAKIAELQTQLPHGIEFTESAFQPDRVDKKIRDFTGNVLQSIAIVFVSMLLFLGLRTGLIVATLVPGAILMSILLMPSFGSGLDQMSLAALIIALGMLVDNAIVVSESTMVQIAGGKSPLQAAVDSATELRVPLLVSTLTTAAAFLPIRLAKSTTGEYTGVIFTVVTLTLLCSWILALTMIPLLCVKFLKVKGEGESMERPLYRAYRRVLLPALRRRGLVVVGAVVVFFGALQLFRFVPVIFFPPSDRTILTVDLELPAGTPIERTQEVVAELEAFFEDELVVGSYPEEGEGILDWASFIGDPAPRFILTYNPGGQAPERAFLLVNTSSFPVLADLRARIEDRVFAHYPDLRANVSGLDYGPPVKWPVEVRVSGKDVERLYDYAGALKEHLLSTPGIKNVQDDWGERTKKIVVEVDQPRSYRAGVSNQDVALSLQTMLSGFEVTQFREDDEIVPITMRSVAAYRDDVDKIGGLNVYSQSTGRSVPLTQVADLSVDWQPSNIRRRDGLPTITVQASLEDGVTATEVNTGLEPWLIDFAGDWGLGYLWEFGGETETSGKANASIAAQLPLAGFVILLLLISQFNSFRRTAIVLSTIPLGVIGVVLGLLVCRSYFGFMTLLGIISLAGIVINNAIVLLDRIRIEIDERGLAPDRAVVNAAQQRLRPILLTTVTTVGGLIPLALDGGMFQPMAIGIIFGLVFATLLTLGFVPVLYSLLFRVSFRDFRY